MTSSQPYLIRAIFEWIVDNNLTPYLMVDATKRGTVVPEDYLDELGRIILNISPGATSGFLITNDEVTFSARFSGQSMGIVVPVYSVRAIYARENGQGMMFNENDEQPPGDVSKKRATLEAIEGTGALGVTVKRDRVDDGKPAEKTSTSKSGDGSGAAPGSNGPDKPAPKKPASKKGGKGGGSHLKVVK